jgi:hypothetical protein
VLLTNPLLSIEEFAASIKYILNACCVTDRQQNLALRGTLPPAVCFSLRIWAWE